MSRTTANNLTREKIQQLLAAEHSHPQEDNTPVEAADYNWHQPHYFTDRQLRKLQDFTKKFAAAVMEKFTLLCQGQFVVTITATTQHFTSEFLHPSTDNEQDYYLPFGSRAARPCGLINIPVQTAIVWAKQLLGDPESGEESSQDLSPLEQSVLSDIAVGIVEALTACCEDLNFDSAGQISKGPLPFNPQGTEELCKITFQVKKADAEDSSEAHVLIRCSELRPVVGKAAQVAGEISAEEASKAVLEHFQQMRLCVTAQLASTQLTVDQILSLQTDDLLVLDKRINEPIELVVNGRTVYYGWPAKQGQQHAILIAANPKLQTEHSEAPHTLQNEDPNNNA